MPLFRRKPKGIPFDITLGDPRGARLVQAVEADDVDGIRDALAEAGSVEDREQLSWIIADVPGHMDTFEAWVEREPDNPTAWLCRGAYGVGWAWDARGGGYAETVSDEQWEVFWDRLRRTEDDLLRAAEMDPQDPVPWTHLLTSGRGMQIPVEELQMRFDEAQSRHPWLMGAHMQHLQSLCEKWYGSDEEAMDFARTTSREAPEGASVHAMIPMAHIEVWLDSDRREGTSSADYEQRADVREEIQEASQRSVFSSAFRDTVSTLHAQNVFAMALWLFGDEHGAKQLVERIGTRRMESPWFYLGDPDGVYGQLAA